MKRKLLFIFSLILGINGVNAQCSVNSAPTNNCTSFSDYINSYTLDGIAATGVTGCSTASTGYGTFATPVWNLQLGNTYTFTSSMGTVDDTFAMWIDLNNDAVYQSSEMIWASTGTAVTHTGSITIPLNSTPANGIRMRLRASYLHVFIGSEACTNGVGTWGETEDHFVNLIPLAPCTGTPGANSVVTPTSAICPEVAVSMNLANTYTNSGITYQWQSSTVAAVGPWTSINNATTTAYTGTSNVTTYYSVAIYCAGQGSLQATAGQVTVGGQVVSTVPYSENFEGVGYNGQLPNCSWAISTTTNITQTYTQTTTQNRSALSGNKFAAFAAGTGTNYFYTNGIVLNAGITYSASMWYKTEQQSLTNFTDLSMLVSMTQSTAGLIPVASSNGPAFSNTYQSLSNTFMVPSSGIYYLAIRATSNGGSYYLSFDDVAVTAPCSINSPTLVVSGASTVCSGQSLNLTVSGANTYTWNTGANTAAVSVTPNVTTNYVVIGYEIASGCTNTMAVTVAVDKCVGISKVNAASGISIYPNPNNGLFTVEMNNSSVKSVQVVDLTGRVILTQTTSDTTLSLNINAFANGIYYVKVQSNDNTEVIKIVKQ